MFVTEDDAVEFLRLEKKRLKCSEKMVETIRSMVTQITRLADVMVGIKDVLIDRRTNN